MGIAENIASVRRFYAAGPAADDRARSGFAADDIVWHVPGANRVSGDYRGKAAVFRELGERMQPLERWELDLVDVMANRDMVVATVRLSAARHGRVLSTSGAHVFRLDDSARIVEAWGFTADQTALDALLDPV